MKANRKLKTKKQKKTKIIYYTDELNDDFAGTNIKQKKVDSNFKFINKNIFKRMFAFLIYYVIAVPVIWFYSRCIRHVKYVNRKAVRKLKEPCFLYGNHTAALDAYSPGLICYPKRSKILVSPDTVSIKGIKNIVQMLGALPVPNDASGMKKFVQAVEYYNKKKQIITIYPEAHIWPFFTGVRNFKDASFAYPVITNSPVCAFFTAYSEPQGFMHKLRRANVTVYVSDPIYPDTTLPRKEAQKKLRDEVYAFMKDCSEKYSTHKVIEYKHISEKPENAESDKISPDDFE